MLSQHRRNLKAVKPIGQVVVGEDQLGIDLLLLDQCERGVAVGGGHDAMPFANEQHFGQFANIGIVLDHDN